MPVYLNGNIRRTAPKIKKTARNIRTAFKDGLILPLASGFRLLLAANTGLFIVLTLANLGDNACAGALTLEPLESAFQRLVFVYMNLRHLFSLPSHISPETTPLPRPAPCYSGWRPCPYYTAFRRVRQQVFGLVKMFLQFPLRSGKQISD